jgi:phospholipase C
MFIGMMIMEAIEKSYSFVFKNLLRAVNPIKKRIMKAECKVHKFINNQSILILQNDGHKKAYELMSSYINDINAGVVWADQDLKSSDHFYNPNKDKGLYGNSNARNECMLYYTKALNRYFYGDIRNAMFYLGAACHLIQDLTVPQHANVMLLNNHRSYEKWVISVHKHHDDFKVSDSGIYLDSLNHYINLNSSKAINTYKLYSKEKNQQLRFFKITSIGLTMAQRTTAGLMLKFCRDIEKIRPIVIEKQQKQFEKMVNGMM